MNYTHTQKGPLSLLLVAIGVATGVAAWTLRSDPPIAAILGCAGAAFLIVAAAFRSLTVADRGEFLSVRFGPLPIFGTTIPYASIRSAQAGRTSLTDGLGIHFIPRRGWTFNLWGMRCVVIGTERGTIRVGTDDPEGLEALLLERSGARA